MTTVLMSVKGINGQLELLEGVVRIRRKGVVGFLSHGLKGDKEINISSISSVQWKDATWVSNGYVQFAVHGGTEAKGGYLQAAGDENSTMFNKKQKAEFEAIRGELQRRIATFSHGASTSSADEIRKLSELRDQGILTKAEFEAKKKQLLGV